MRLESNKTVTERALLLPESQRLVQQAAVKFSQATQLPQDLVIGAFFWKLHQLRATEAVTATSLGGVPSYDTIQAYWEFRKEPEYTGHIPHSKGEQWVHKQTGKACPAAWSTDFKLALKDTIGWQPAPVDQASAKSAPSSALFGIVGKELCPYLTDNFLKAAYDWNQTQAQPLIDVQETIAAYWSQPTSVKRWSASLVQNTGVAIVKEFSHRRSPGLNDAAITRDIQAKPWLVRAALKGIKITDIQDDVFLLDDIAETCRENTSNWGMPGRRKYVSRASQDIN